MNLSAVDLNLLFVLHVLLEEGSVARAAARLHVTSPAVSNALGRLRVVFDDPLFVRHGRGLVPTPRALALAPRLRAAMAELSTAVGPATFDPERTTRTFSLACSDAELVFLLPQIARAFTAKMPHARLHAVSVDQLEASGGLAGSEIDAAIAPAHALGPGLRAEPLYDDEGVIVVRRDHPVKKGRITRKDFNALRHVDIRLALGKGGIGHDQAEAFFAEHGLRRDVALIVPSFSAAAMIAASTDLATGLPRRLAERFLTMLPLRIVAMPPLSMRFQMQLVWHERAHADAGATCFRQVVIEAAGARLRGRERRVP